MGDKAITRQELESELLKQWIKINEELDKREERRHAEYMRHNDSVQKILSSIEKRLTDQPYEQQKALTYSMNTLNDNIKELYATKVSNKTVEKRVSALEKDKNKIITVIVGAVLAGLLKLLIK